MKYWKRRAFSALSILAIAGAASAEELLLEPSVQGADSGQVVHAAQIGGGYFLDVQDMADSLGFGFEPGTGRGNFMDKGFSAADTDEVRIRGRDYYPADFYERALGVKLGVDTREMKLSVDADRPLPTTLKRQSEARRRNMLPPPADDPFSNYEFDERMFSFPVVDLIYRRNEYFSGWGRDYETRSHGDYYQANFGMIFLGLDTQATIFGDNYARNSPSEPRARILAGRTFLEEPGNKLNLVRFQAGDMQSAGNSIFSRGFGGRGVAASSFKDLVISADRTININGPLPAGWEAELYLDNQLIGFRNAGADGRYQFARVPVHYGLNNFRVVFYGPFGEVREEERRFYAGTSPVGAGELGYNLNAHQSRRYLIEANEPDTPDSNDITADAIFYYGMDDYITLIAGASQAESATEKGTQQQFATMGIQTALNGFAVQYNLNQNLGTREFGHHIDTQGNIYIGDIFARYEYYGDIRSPISHFRGGYLKDLFEGRLTGWIPFVSVPYFVSYMHGGYHTDATFDEARLRLSPNFERYYNLTVENVWRKDEAGTENSIESLLQASYGKFRIHARARYRTDPDNYLRDYGAFSEYRWNRNTFIQASWTHDCRSNYSELRDLDTASFSVGRLFDFGGITFAASGDTDRNVSLGIVYNASFGRTQDGDAFINSETQMTNYGAINVHAADENGQPLEGVKLIVSGREAPAITDKSGNALIVNLESYQKISAAVDEADVGDLSLVPEWTRKKLVLRPGAVREVDVRFDRLGGMEGQLAGMRDGETYRIKIMDGNGTIVAARTADADGAFIFDGIKYGEYALMVVNGAGNLHNVEHITIDRSFLSMKTPLMVSLEKPPDIP